MRRIPPKPQRQVPQNGRIPLFWRGSPWDPQRIPFGSQADPLDFPLDFSNAMTTFVLENGSFACLLACLLVCLLLRLLACLLACLLARSLARSLARHPASLPPLPLVRRLASDLNTPFPPPCKSKAETLRCLTQTTESLAFDLDPPYNPPL